jgi:iron(III) transport system substrate-binding protein
VRKYGWDYYRRLRANDAVVEGGNSAVMRRIETGDRPVGIVLQENLLKGRDTHSPAELVYPADGAIVIPTAMAIMASTRQPAAAEKLMRYLTEREGLEAIVRGWMYACDPALAPPKGGLPFAELLKTGLVLDYKAVREVTPQREQLKEMFSRVMFE